MIPYLYKFIVCSAFLFLVYKVLLEGEKMHLFNRLYLLFALIMSFVIPLINFSSFSTADPGMAVAFFGNPIISRVGTIDQTALKKVDYLSPFLLITYATITTFFLLRFIINIRSILVSTRRNSIQMYENCKVVLMKAKITPHSFLNFIFVNSDDYLKGDIDKRILHHELSHVRQKHSLDVLFVELLCVFLWFNPVLFLFRKAFQLNNEFLADQAVVEKFGDSHSYQAVLLNELSKNASPPLTSASNYFITKQRLVMITKPSSFISTLFRKAAVVPVFIAAVFIFSTKTFATQGGSNLDTAIVHMLQRNIVFPESLSKGEEGMALLHLTKSNGSLMIRMLYTSYKDYGAGMDQTLTEIANKRDLLLKFSQEELIVPVYYRYFDGPQRQSAEGLTPEAKKAISQLGRSVNVNSPIIMIGRLDKVNTPAATSSNDSK